MSVAIWMMAAYSVMAVAVVMMLPPVVVFAVLNRFFSVGGISGSLAGQ